MRTAHPAELRRGDRVRVLGRFRRRRVVITLDRNPVELDASKTAEPGEWLLCGYERTESPRGNRRRFHPRITANGELVELLEEGPPNYRRHPDGVIRPDPRPAPPLPR